MPIQNFFKKLQIDEHNYSLHEIDFSEKISQLYHF